MRYNTGLEFTQPSGGNVDHMNHAGMITLATELGRKPVGTSPSLPSGSVWLRDNEDVPRRAERLEYQGEDTQFQTRTVEGYAAYINLRGWAGSTGVTAIGLRIQWPLHGLIVEDTYFFTLEEVDVRAKVFINMSGLYKISCCTNFVTESSSSTTGFLTMRRNEIDVTSSSTVISADGDGGGGHVCINFVGPLDEGDDIEFFAGKQSTGGTIFLHGACSTFEFIRPLDLGNGSNVV